MLDFGKAYDDVDCDFLQGALARFGFYHEWIIGISSLYSSTWARSADEAESRIG